MRVMVTTVLDCSQHPENDLQPILLEAVQIAVAALTKGKSAGVVIYQQNLFKQEGNPCLML